MKKIPHGGFLCAALLFLGWTAAVADVVSLGDNTFSITRQASNTFKRDTDALKAQVQDEAAKYCAAQGKQLKVVSLTAEKPWILLGFPSAKIVFKALNPGEATAAAAAPAEAVTAVPAAPPAPPALTTSEMYDDLMKLEDLHKKGILNDDEFQSEKRKILNRTH